jgi:hypothetical protein
VTAGFPRLVRWAIQVDASTPPGAYEFNLAAECRCEVAQSASASANNAVVFVGGHNVYVPLTLGQE